MLPKGLLTALRIGPDMEGPKWVKKLRYGCPFNELFVTFVWATSTLLNHSLCEIVTHTHRT